MRARWLAAAKQSGTQDIWREDRSSSECCQIRGSKRARPGCSPQATFLTHPDAFDRRVLSQKHGLWPAYWSRVSESTNKAPQVVLMASQVYMNNDLRHNCFRVPRWLEEQQGQPRNTGENRRQLQLFLKSLSDTYWETTRDFPGGPVAKTLSSQRRRPRVQSLVTLQIRVHMLQLRPRAGKQISILK